MSEALHSIALSLVHPQPSVSHLWQLRQKAGSATAVIENRKCLKDIIPDISEGFCTALDSSLDAAMERAEKELSFCEKHSIRVLTPDDDAYPARLLHCDDAPVALFYRGNADLNARHVVCIIGTRKCTVYGQDIIRNFVTDLKRLVPDTLIVSGLAYGVDIAAHTSALNNGMETVAVLAHGLDTIYPSLHRNTAKEMLSHGGLLTEYPSSSKIDKRNFLQRNRIVAGLSDACILPESASHGGGLVTCRISTDYGRSVFAFPGPVNAEYSKGCNNLIRDNGAGLITDAADFVAAMGWDMERKLDDMKRKGIEMSLFPELSADEKSIADALKNGGDMTSDQLVCATGLPVSTITSSLFMMEMKGIVKQCSGDVYHILI